MIVNRIHSLALHYYRGIWKNVSFLILLGSSICYFFVNYVLKINLKGEDYGDFSLILVLLNVSSSFCFLGSDQLLMRSCKIDDGSITVERGVIILMVTCFVTYTIISSYLFKKYYFADANLYELIIINLLMGSLTFQYTIFRVLRFFEHAQIQKNGWKILFFIISLLIVLIYGTINIPTLLVTLIVVFIISMLFGIRKAGTIKFNLVEGA